MITGAKTIPVPPMQDGQSLGNDLGTTMSEKLFLRQPLRRTLDRIDTPRMPEPLHHLECSSSKKDIGRLLSLLPPIAPSPCTRKAMPHRASDYEARRDRGNPRTRRPPPSL